MVIGLDDVCTAPVFTAAQQQARMPTHRNQRVVSFENIAVLKEPPLAFIGAFFSSSRKKVYGAFTLSTSIVTRP
jgi:hypothetical protein